MRLSLLFTMLAPSILAASQCHLYHHIVEDGRIINTITKQRCSKSSEYCAYVVYSDVNPKAKQGYAVGCDRTDCEDSINGTEWNHLGGRGNYTCRRHKDYGTDGRICCCKGNLCNHHVPPNSALRAFPILVLPMCALLLR